MVWVKEVFELSEVELTESHCISLDYDLDLDCLLDSASVILLRVMNLWFVDLKKYKSIKIFK